MPPVGDAGRQAPNWSNEQRPAGGQNRKAKPGKGRPVDDWPLSTDGSPRGGQDAPRGHDNVDGPANTGRFAKPGAPLNGGPGDTAPVSYTHL